MTQEESYTLLLSVECTVRSGQHDLSSVPYSIQQQLDSTGATWVFTYPCFKKNSTAGHSKTFIIKGLSVQVFSPLHHRCIGRGTLWHLITSRVLMCHFVILHLCWLTNSKSQLIQPIATLLASISFSLLFSGMMTVSHNGSQREAGCNRAECWKACAITPTPARCEHHSHGGTERESGELLIPRTIGHLNPRQAPYLHWAKALPEPYDRAGGMIAPCLTATNP